MRKYLLPAFFKAGHMVTLGYHYCGLTYPMIHTDRYADSRPADMLILHVLTTALVVIGIPVLDILLFAGIYAGIIPWSAAGVGLLDVGILLLPPILTTAYLELRPLLVRNRPRS